MEGERSEKKVSMESFIAMLSEDLHKKNPEISEEKISSFFIRFLLYDVRPVSRLANACDSPEATSAANEYREYAASTRQSSDSSRRTVVYSRARRTQKSAS